MGCRKCHPERKIHGNPGVFQETEKSQIKNLKAHLKEIEVEQQRQPKPSRRREIIKIRAEINNIESKKTVEQINETKSWFLEKNK